MDFVIDVIFIEQPLGAATSQSTRNGSHGTGNEREHATVTELLPIKCRSVGCVGQASINRRQVILQRIAHDILEPEPQQRGLGLRLPEQTLGNIYSGSHRYAS